MKVVVRGTEEEAQEALNGIGTVLEELLGDEDRYGAVLYDGLRLTLEEGDDEA